MTDTLEAAALRIARETGCIPGAFEWEEVIVDFAHRLISWLSDGQEPVAWIDNYGMLRKHYADSTCIPLYTHPTPKEAPTAQSDICSQDGGKCGVGGYCKECDQPLSNEQLREMLDNLRVVPNSQQKICAICGFTRGEHHHDGAAYGVCGAFTTGCPVCHGIDCLGHPNMDPKARNDANELTRLRAENATKDAHIAELERVLRRKGFVECDIPACNCGSWHHRYGLPERMIEISDELRDAGVLDNSTGNLPLNAIKKLRAENEALRKQRDDFHMDYRVKCDEETKRLHTENAKLRDALAEIREVWAGSEQGEPIYASEAYAVRLVKQCYQLAVEALDEARRKG